MAFIFAVMSYTLFTLLGLIIVRADYDDYIERIDQEIFNSISRLSFIYEQTGNLEDSASLEYDRQLVRLFNADMKYVFGGRIYTEYEQINGTEFEDITLNFSYGTENYRALSVPIQSRNGPVAYIQFAHKVDTLRQYMRERAFTGAFLSLIAAVIIFVLSIYIERRFLEPILDQQKYLERFAQHAGHELRTPLANMRSTLELAEMTKSYEQSVPEVIENIDHMTKLLNSLMSIETIDLVYDEKKPINLSSMAEELITSFSAKAKQAHIQLSGDINQDVIVLGDEELIKTAIANLLENALKFTRENGEIKLIVRQHKIVVKDTGIGMSMDVSNRIFERFFKADVKHSNAGFGLGLSLVKRIIELHRWSIEVSSVPGKGSRFKILFEE